MPPPPQATSERVTAAIKKTAREWQPRYTKRPPRIEACFRLWFELKGNSVCSSGRRLLDVRRGHGHSPSPQLQYDVHGGIAGLPLMVKSLTPSIRVPMLAVQVAGRYGIGSCGASSFCAPVWPSEVGLEPAYAI